MMKRNVMIRRYPEGTLGRKLIGKVQTIADDIKAMKSFDRPEVAEAMFEALITVLVYEQSQVSAKKEDVYSHVVLTEDEHFFLQECVAKRLGIIEEDDDAGTEQRYLEAVKLKLS